MWKILRNTSLVCLFSLIAAICFLSMTTTGLKLDLAILARFTPGKLVIKQVSGNLLSEFSLHGLSYEDKENSAHIETFSLHWSPSAIFRKKLLIHSISANQATIVLTKTGTGTSSSSDIDIMKLGRHISIQHIDFNQILIKHAGAEINFTGSLEKNWRVNWTISLPNLHAYFPEHEGSVISTGTISGPLLSPTIDTYVTGKKLIIHDQHINHITGHANIIAQPKIDSLITLSAQGITLQQRFIPKVDVTITGNITREGQALSAHLSALINRQYHMLAHFTLPVFSDLTDINQSIEGNINLTSSNLSLLTSVLPQLKNPRGILRADLTLSGRLNNPKLLGELHLQNGSVEIPLLGITATQINLHANMNTLQQLIFNGELHSGKGSAQLQGDIQLKKQGYPITLAVKGNQIEAVNLPEYHIIVSPNLALQFVNQNLDLRGDILVPSARIEPKNFDNTITLPDEVIFVDQKKAGVILPFTTTLQLNIQLGKNIHIAYEDLEAKISGKLRIIQNAYNTPTAIGELYINDGMYHAYNQQLKINNGRLVYAGGSLLNPVLNVTANKEIRTVGITGGGSNFSSSGSAPLTMSQTITVGVRVQGMLDNPAFILYSNPSMSQGDILSYLLFGFSQSQASGQQTSMLLSALSALNPNAGGYNNIAKKLQDTLGLTELNVESTQVFDPTKNSVSPTTTVGVGKKLAPNLYLHYSMGLFEPISIFNVRYQFRPNWAIQTETSTIDNGVDLLFGFERD